MASNGTIICRTYTSDAMIPVANVTVAVTRRNSDGSHDLIALRKSDTSGRTAPISIAVADTPVPQPGAPATPAWTLVDITADAPGFERITVENVQVFSGVTTEQSFALIPLSEIPEFWNQQESFYVPTQNL